jgi:hypothetical protein
LGTGEGKGQSEDVLHKRYDNGKINCKLVNRQMPKKNCVAWNNDGKDHERYWTCVFVCPLTGECFLSGELISLLDYDASIHEQMLVFTSTSIIPIGVERRRRL